MQRIWKRAKDSPNGNTIVMSNRKVGNAGCKWIQIDLYKVADIPFNRRATLRSLS